MFDQLRSRRVSSDQLIQTLGLPGLVIGAILEGDAITFPAGILAHRGLFRFEHVVLAATLGAVLIANALFLAGRLGGTRPFVRRVLLGGAAQRMRARLEARVIPAILIVRFVYGMKSIGALLIGTTSITWWRYAGHAIQALLGRVAVHWHLLAGIGLFLAGVGLLWYGVGRRRAKGRTQ